MSQLHSTMCNWDTTHYYTLPLQHGPQHRHSCKTIDTAEWWVGGARSECVKLQKHWILDFPHDTMSQIKHHANINTIKYSQR